MELSRDFAVGHASSCNARLLHGRVAVSIEDIPAVVKLELA
jgi:hypothetical protein